MLNRNSFDVIIIGGGHAGIEAAVASSKMGCKSLLLTQDILTIGKMSCNPAIGGIGKGHLVKEVAALGGVMAKAIDNSGIQFKTLNSSKGPAVHSTRAQADKSLYNKEAYSILKTQKGLTILSQEVKELVLKSYNIVGVITTKELLFNAEAIILTTGTFLNGKISIGKSFFSGGRVGDNSSKLLPKFLYRLPLNIKRLKTGTPPRLNINSINFKILEAQYSDYPLPYFSFYKGKAKSIRQVPCYITKTNKITHEIISSNIEDSPMYNGNIKSIGPRYCPSIEDKVVKFYNKPSHQIYLEPEGLNSNKIYPNGLSTCLPYNIQKYIVRSIKGLEKAHIISPGYAIEYDFINPIDLKLSLESKLIKGLFLAGQVNGSTGYEEAAGQGIIAGINAARMCFNKEAWTPRRDQAYLGVLLDDLCTQGVEEPYRIFTSRAEYRLILREDNADLRLTEIGRKLGLISESHWKSFCAKVNNIEAIHQKLKEAFIYPNTKASNYINKLLVNPLLKETNCKCLLKRPAINYNILLTSKGFPYFDAKAFKEAEIQIKYSGYIVRQYEDVKRNISNELIKVPYNIEYNNISGLSNEVTEKLKKHHPSTIGQASRIAGITPVAISMLLIWLRKSNMLKLH
ncbi:tRNA uridine-5-carboxymethylaminomethyl(34) synthesis enzyme MnmG [Candidatus Tremblaya phenacola]|uniref:tRNA uridine-5-carboxymethylaminomethyl(34) synthesis enzyme MnmG n=1 Tax=Candidatus Tremblayella phenacoccinincola TaxID=1010676 RepID=UPI00132F7054|nr:tRNA uridine-5-carboxymethylaminomethyl(34) synthesis enzyme MnmG [Candidatus Tremblaya phenacola]KAH0998229.1 tRNA-5-carboxymethylaminomethyl-2-thiouridine(34) synthesis protein MnmG [Candidatus Tremblaya phenacola]